MSVSWLTWVESNSQVLWGVEAEGLTNMVTGNFTNYTTHHVNLGADVYVSGYLHSAVIPGLEPSTTYYYACGDERKTLSSARSFRTPGAVGPEERLTVALLGDLGQTNDSRLTAEAVMQQNTIVDVVLHAGDFSYADCEQGRWDSFMQMLDPIASHVPWMVSAGNHEIELGTTVGGPFEAYEHRFRMPTLAPANRSLDCGPGGGLDGGGVWCGMGLWYDLPVFASGSSEGMASDDGHGIPDGVVEAAIRAKQAQDPWGPQEVTGWSASDASGAQFGPEEYNPTTANCTPSQWSGTYDYGNSFYSFDVGPMHVVVLNPYTATGEGSNQQTWLIQDLADTDRSLTPWLIAMFHCPWYNSNYEHQKERQAATAMRAIEPLFAEHKAAIVVSGHVHAYERTRQVLNGTLAGGGPVHLIVGGAGNREDHNPDYYRLPEWSAFRNGSAFGLGTLQIVNSTSALWEWKSNAPDPVVHDSAWIYNPFSLS